MAAVFVYPPYSIPWMNKSCKITQVLYSVLNLLFIVLIGFGSKLSETQRYFVVGFSMIGVVVLVLATNVGFSVYQTGKTLLKRWKSSKKASVKPEGSQDKTKKDKATNNQSDRSIDSELQAVNESSKLDQHDDFRTTKQAEIKKDN